MWVAPWVAGSLYLILTCRAIWQVLSLKWSEISVRPDVPSLRSTSTTPGSGHQEALMTCLAT